MLSVSVFHAQQILTVDFSQELVQLDVQEWTVE